MRSWGRPYFIAQSLVALIDVWYQQFELMVRMIIRFTIDGVHLSRLSELLFHEIYVIGKVLFHSGFFRCNMFYIGITIMLRIKFISIIDSTFCAISLFTFTVNYYIYFSDFQKNKKKHSFILNGQDIQVPFKIVI